MVRRVEKIKNLSSRLRNWILCGILFTFQIPAAGTPSQMTASAYLHTSGSKILNSANQEVGLSGVNWFGFETDQNAPHGLWTRNWKSVLNQIKRQGYNVIRALQEAGCRHRH